MANLKWWQFFTNPFYYIKMWQQERTRKTHAKKLDQEMVVFSSASNAAKAMLSQGSAAVRPKNAKELPPAKNSLPSFKNPSAIDRSLVAPAEEVIHLAQGLRTDLVDYIHRALHENAPAKPEDVETLVNKYAALKWGSQELKGLSVNIKMTIPRIAALLTELNNIITGSKVSTTEALRALIVNKSKDIDSGNDAWFKDQVNDKKFKTIIDKHLSPIHSPSSVSPSSSSRLK